MNYTVPLNTHVQKSDFSLSWNKIQSKWPYSHIMIQNHSHSTPLIDEATLTKRNHHKFRITHKQDKLRWWEKTANQRIPTVARFCIWYWSLKEVSVHSKIFLLFEGKRKIVIKCHMLMRVVMPLSDHCRYLRYSTYTINLVPEIPDINYKLGTQYTLPTP